jgi:uncharacterized protein YecE (DUF72 family)
MSVLRRSSVMVGLCGFAEPQGKVFGDFDSMEIQSTFYQPPRRSTAARWKERAGDAFVFSMKAWQLVTHAATSPTYRRLREPLSNSAKAMAGGLRWNPVTRMAWQRTLDIADALGAKAIVLQTPKSFVPSRQNVERTWRFFEQIERRNRLIVFEPRGEAWSDEILTPLLHELDIVHGVDPFLRPSVGKGIRYWRLHGLPAYNYHYRYTDDELALLRRWAHAQSPAWILFNNVPMADDARRFLALLP